MRKVHTFPFERLELDRSLLEDDDEAGFSRLDELVDAVLLLVDMMASIRDIYKIRGRSGWRGVASSRDSGRARGDKIIVFSNWESCDGTARFV